MREAPPLAGVIGYPIGHSKSPILHGHWLRRYGISGHYVPIEVAPADLAETLQTLPRLGFKGINVTLPHKENVLAMADKVSDRAALIGAANTITFTGHGKIQADNTDGVGFLANVKQGAPGWNARGAPAVVLGAGGAARAVISALLSDGAPEVILANRTRSRAEDLRQAFGAKVHVVDWGQVGAHLTEAGLLVNTTSLGMEGNGPLTLSLERLPTNCVVTDIVYAPLETPLLRDASARGCVSVDGLGMLLHQAAPGFHRWFGVAPEVDQDLRDAVLGG